MDSKINYSKNKTLFLILFSLAVIIVLLQFIYAANPEGPDQVIVSSNTTKVSSAAKMINISGGYIASANLTATIQDARWKAFVGYVSGKFTLSDSSSSTIYDWTLTTITGRVYSTRNSSGVNWAVINCSNITNLNQENLNINQSNANDNLNKTFNYTSGATHNSFYVGAVNIPANTCPTLNTYVNNGTQDNYFEEMALYDGYNMVYATIMEPRRTGYNGQNYDFQMIVPENGAPGFTGATAYYLYVEIGT
jgi:hypothetical protein